VPTIVHFGVDEQATLQVLAQDGYSIKTCGISIEILNLTLDQEEADAIVISEASAPMSASLVRSARPHSTAPLVVFAAPSSQCDYSEVDLIIPPFTQPASWLSAIAELMQECKATRTEAGQIRQRAAELHQKRSSLGDRLLRHATNRNTRDGGSAKLSRPEPTSDNSD